MTVFVPAQAFRRWRRERLTLALINIASKNKHHHQRRAARCCLRRPQLWHVTHRLRGPHVVSAAVPAAPALARYLCLGLASRSQLAGHTPPSEQLER